jgi:hypothetical protein
MPWPKEFHLELGYLSPAPGIRRTIRFALLAAAFGVAVGGDLGTSKPAPSVGEVDRRAYDASEMAAADPATDSATNSHGAAVVASRSSSARPAPNRCRDQEWPYLDRNCLFGASGKSVDVRVISLIAPEQAPPPPAEAAVAAAAANQTMDRPQKKQTTQVRRPKRAQDIGYNAGTAYAMPYSAYREGAYRDRGWSW